MLPKFTDNFAKSLNILYVTLLPTIDNPVATIDNLRVGLMRNIALRGLRWGQRYGDAPLKATTVYQNFALKCQIK